MKKDIKVGQKIYVETSLYLSHGSDDVIGGLATINKVEEGISGGVPCLFVSVKEHPGHSYNWSHYLKKDQERLKKEFGKNKAHASPDIDRPWIEKGDTVNGKIYDGDPIW
jgi:hypothetical protein